MAELGWGPPDEVLYKIPPQSRKRSGTMGTPRRTKKSLVIENGVVKKVLDIPP
jgi:hypothetical protein